jgi:hypothetical protein
MLHTLVDKVFVITTLNSDRVDYIRSHLYDNNILFDFVVAPNYNIITDKIVVNDGGDTANKNHKASISLISAYSSIIESARISKFDKVCIIEDDCFFSNGWVDKFNLFYNNVPNDWDLLNVGYHPLHDTDSVKEKYDDYVSIPLNWHHTTHCMFIKNTCYDEFLRISNKWNYTLPIDYLFNEIYKNKSYKSYIPVEKIVHQLSVRNICYEISGTDLRFKSSIYDT